MSLTSFLSSLFQRRTLISEHFPSAMIAISIFSKKCLSLRAKQESSKVYEAHNKRMLFTVAIVQLFTCVTAFLSSRENGTIISHFTFGFD